MSEQSKTEKATTLLKQKLKEADAPALGSDEYSFTQWVQEVEGILANFFGDDSRQLKNFKDSVGKEVFVQHFYGGEDTEYGKRQIAHAKAALNAILSEIEEFGLPETQEATTSSKPKAFIAHGGETKALEKLKSFLDALGIEPLIVEEQAIEGRLTESQVEHYLQQADCGIVLATQGGIIDAKSGSKHPRLNVIDELGRLRKACPDKTILLLERGTELPSNVSRIVHISFTRNNMEKAFSKVAKELRAFGIIRATTIKEP